jgi:uncharacterized membrane protein
VNTRTVSVSALERLLARLMLAGVTLSAIALAAGLAMWLAGRQTTRLLDAGLIALMGTPVLRVAMSFVESIRMRDWFFVAATLAVLMLLATTLILSYRLG